jgi:hypothetical protein
MWHNTYQNHPLRNPKTLAGATRFTQLRFFFLRTCNSWSQKTDSVFINNIDTVHIILPLVNICYWFGLRHKKFNSSLLFTTHITVPAQFWLTPVHAMKNILFRDTAVAKTTFKINHRKNSRHFMLVFIKVYTVLYNPRNIR